MLQKKRKVFYERGSKNIEDYPSNVDRPETWRKGIPLVTREMGTQNISIGITEFEDGGEIVLHRHNCEEHIMIIEGTAMAENENVYHPFTIFDSTFVPAGILYRFMNRSGRMIKIL